MKHTEGVLQFAGSSVGIAGRSGQHFKTVFPKRPAASRTEINEQHVWRPIDWALEISIAPDFS